MSSAESLPTAKSINYNALMEIDIILGLGETSYRIDPDGACRTVKQREVIKVVPYSSLGENQPIVSSPLQP